jgi:hypothetical protein
MKPAPKGLWGVAMDKYNFFSQHGLCISISIYAVRVSLFKNV